MDKNISKNIGWLRLQIHVVEKGSKKVDAEIKGLYEQCKKFLSEEEKSWCERILNGQKKINKPPHENIIFTRRSIRNWTDEPLKDDEIGFLLDAACWAPSSCNRQPIEIVVIKNPKMIEKLGEFRGQPFIKKSVCVFAVLVNLEIYHRSATYFSLLDAGAAIQNILLAAETIGIGGCWVNMSPDTKQYEETHKLIECPNSHKIISLIPLGRPSKIPPAPGRKTMLLRIDKFGKKS